MKESVAKKKARRTSLPSDSAAGDTSAIAAKGVEPGLPAPEFAGWKACATYINGAAPALLRSYA